MREFESPLTSLSFLAIECFGIYHIFSVGRPSSLHSLPSPSFLHKKVEEKEKGREEAHNI